MHYISKKERQMRLKGFKKFIIIIITIWLVIVTIGLLVSRSMQGKIINILSEQAGRHLTTEIHVRKSDIHFSIFKKFPLASLELRNVSFMIPKTVELKNSILLRGDTLLYAKNLYLQMNLRSLIQKRYELEKISINKGYLQIINDSKGNSSLNILRKQEKGPDKDFSASINEFSSRNLTLYYTDKTKNTITTTQIKDGKASGEFSKEDFLVKLKARGKLTAINANNQVLKPDQPFKVDTDIEFKKNRYTINRGSFNLSNIPFTVLGSISLTNNTLIDLLFSAKNVPLKQMDDAVLRGLLGESGFQPKGGTMDIQSTLLGYTRHSLPSIKATFTVRKGKVYDTKRKISYDDIYFTGNADNGSRHLPKTTTIRVDSFYFKIGNSYQVGKLKIQNLINPVLSANSKGYVEVNDIGAIIQIPDIQLVEGNFTNNVAVTGFILKDAIKDNNILDKMKVWGDLSIKKIGLAFEKYKLPYTQIDGDIKLYKDLSLLFDSLKSKSGHSDILIHGKLEHAFRKDGIPQFKGAVYSKYFLADDFIKPTTSVNKHKTVVNFPDSVIINGSIAIEKFQFGNFISTNSNGAIKYANKKMVLSPFSMKGFDGKLNGQVIFEQVTNGNIEMFAKATLQQVDINKLFIGCNNFSQDVINSEHLSGTINGNLDFSATWTNGLDFISESLISQCAIKLLNGELINYQPLLGLSDFINVEELAHIRFDELETSVSIRNKVVTLDQTNIASSAITFDGSGMHDFDNKYEYRLQLGLSDVLWRKAKRKKKEVTEFGYIVDDGVGHTMLPLLISGKGTSFNVKYDKRKARETFKEKISEEKKLLKDLFNGGKTHDTAEGPEFAKEGEPFVTEVKPKEENTLEKTDSGTYKVNSSDHSVTWDDSEDEDDQ